MNYCVISKDIFKGYIYWIYNTNFNRIYLTEVPILHELSPLYLMPIRFNGEESERNRLFVPAVVVELKDQYDDIVEDLLDQGKINGYSCTPTYKGNSFVPSELTIIARNNREDVFTQTINIW